MIAYENLAVMMAYENYGSISVAMAFVGALWIWIPAIYTFGMHLLPGYMTFAAPTSIVTIAASSNIHYSLLWAIAICTQAWYAVIQGSGLSSTCSGS